MEKLKKEFKKLIESGTIPVFEIEVIRDGEKDWVIFDISISDNKVIAHHEALTEAEKKSDKIAFKSVEIDADFGLNYHLNELLEECQTALMESEFVDII
jgi:hypothetical protein